MTDIKSAVSSKSSSNLQLVIIDDRVNNSDTIIKYLPSSAYIRRISANEDGLSAISRHIAEVSSNLDSIHIICHASPGYLILGANNIDKTQIEERANTIRSWRLLTDGEIEICLYGCSLASGEQGEIFIKRLQEIAGIPVSASTTPVGHHDMGGNWELDFSPQNHKPNTLANLNIERNWIGRLETNFPTLSVTISGVTEATTGIDPNYLHFKVILSEPATSAVTLNWRTLAGTVNNNDLSLGYFDADRLTIAAGQTTAFISIRIDGDSVDEADESVVLELYNLNGAEFAGGAERITATGIILDDDGTGENRALLVSSVELIEGDSGSQTAVFNVTLSRPALTDLTFNYQTVDGSATAGEDYVAQTGTLTFLAGQTEATVEVQVNGDSLIEASETFSLLVRPQAGSAAAIANGLDGATGQALLLDDDTNATLPVVTVVNARNSEATTGIDPNYLEFKVILSEPATSAVTLNWRTLAGTVNNNDLSLGYFDADRLTIAAGQTTAFISIRIDGDSVDEADESVVLELYNLNGAEFAGGAERITATGIILDDDGTGENRALLVSSVELIEGDSGSQTAVFNVTLSRPALTDLTFNYQTVDGSATAGEDYVAQTGTLTFLAGQTEATVEVQVNGDSLIEASETFSLLVRPQAGSAAAIANGLDGATGQALLLDDDTNATLPVVTVVNARNSEATTGIDPNYLEFKVILSEPATSAVTLNWRTLAGTVNNNDLSLGYFDADRLTIAAGQTTAFISIRIDGDSVDEADESVVLELYNLNGAEFAGGAERITATGIILDDDGTGENRALLVSSVELIEGDSGSQTAVFNVTLSRPALTDLTFNYQTVDGSATAGEDYVAQTGTLTFLAGQTEATVEVQVNGDSLIEASETFSLLVRPQAGSAAAIANGLDGATGQALLLDDDTNAALPVVTVVNARNSEATTGSDPNYLEFKVILSEPATSAVTLNWRTLAGTVNNNDLSLGYFDADRLTIAAGQTTAFISIRIDGDSVDEADESVVLELYNLNGAEFAGGAERITATGIILDDDGTGENRALLVSSVELIEGDSGSQTAVFNVTLSRPALTDLTFNYQTVDGSATAGEDYVAQTGTLTFLAGQTEATVEVQVNGDSLIEASETFSLLVRPQAGSAAAIANGLDGATGQALLLDDDTNAALPVVTVVNARNSEATTGSDPNYLEFKVILSEPATSAVTLNWRTLAGTVNNNDLSLGYFDADRLTIAAGQTTAFISIRIDGDSVDEADESVVLELYNLNGAEFAGGAERITATGIILDDDGTGENRALLVSSVELIEGDSGSQTAVFNVTLSRPALTDLTFNYQTVDGSATAGEDYVAQTGTLTFLAGQTEATVEVQVNGDSLIEASETFSLLVRPQAGSAAAIANGLDGATGQALLLDDDTNAALPVVTVVNARNSEATTGSDPNYLEFKVILSEPATSAVTLNWRTLAGTVNNNDLSLGYFDADRLTIAAGQTTAFISIRIDGDSVDEADESVVLELYNLNGAEFAGGAERITATGIILDDDGTGENRALLVSSVELIEGDSGSQTAVFNVTLSRPALTDLTFNYQTVDGSATAGEDYVAQTGTLTFLAGQTEATVEVQVNGDYVLENDEFFTLTITPQDGSSAPVEATATVISDDLQNPPTANYDSYQVESGASLSRNAGDGLLSNDSDFEGDSISAELLTNPSHGNLILNSDGSFTYTPDETFTGNDTFTYRAFDGIGYSTPATVSLIVNAAPPPFSGGLTVPESLAPGDVGTATFTYQNNSASDKSGILVLVVSKAGLLLDPLTGQYSDSLFLLGLGDGIGDIASGETGVLSFQTKMANFPKQLETVSVSIADAKAIIDWASQEASFKPDFLPDSVWNQIYSNFKAAVGTTAGTLIEELAENAHFLADLGANSSSTTTALAFELEQAGDFGSLVERGQTGSLGKGWAFVGDLGLDISANGDVALKGSTDFTELFALSADNAAYYIVSASVGQTVSLTGAVIGAAPPNRPTFSKNIDGSYTVGGDFGGVLNKTSNGFQIDLDAGINLRFDENGRFLKAVTENGLETQANYNAEGQLSALSGPFGNSLLIERDQAGQPVKIIDADGSTVELDYSADGSQLVKASQASGSASFGYDNAGNLTQTQVFGGPTTAFGYDTAGRLVSIDLANGLETASISYDSLGGYTITNGAGQNAKVSLAPGGTVASVTDGAGNQSTLIYDAAGQLIGAQLPDGSTASFSFDNLGRLTSVTDPNGSTLVYGYTGDSTRPTSFTDANGSTRTFSYDAKGQMIAATWPDGTRLQFNYDENGNLTGYTNRRGDAANYSYDELGNLLSETDGTAGAVSYSYDIDGRLISATNADGVTSIGYDSVGRINLIEYPNGRSLAYTYDEAGRRTSMTDQDGNQQFYSYDTAGRLQTLANGDGRLVLYSYDTAGNLIGEDNGNGTSTTYAYDNAGRLTEIVNLAPDASINSRYIYEYDAAGNRIAMKTSDGDWSYGYDASGQLTSANFVSARSDISDKSIQYHYDAAGNRTSVIEDGIETLYTSNALNQYLTVGNASYSYDDDGNLIAKTDASATWSYAYDLENRLISVTTSTGDVTEYEYDVFGNRTAIIENGVRTDFLVDPFGLGDVISEYANDGSLIANYAHGLGLASRQAADGSTAFYDLDGVFSVVGLTDASGLQANRYGYTPFGSELYENEAITNGFEFNGGLGVFEDNNNLIFMRARFYDDGSGRFLSSDPLWIGGDTFNLYRFSENNPINLVDPNGESPIVSIGLYGSGFAYELGVFGTFLYAYSTSGGNEYYKQELIHEFFGSEDAPINGWTAFNFVPWNKVFSFGRQTTSWLQKSEKYWHKIPEKIDDFIDAIEKANDYYGYAQIYEKLSDLLFGSEPKFDSKIIDDFVLLPQAHSDGDPHIRTFDDLAYDFQAVGEFVLARGSGLELQARQQPWGNRSDVSINTAIAMQVGDAVVGIYKDQPNPVNINGEFIEISSGETLAVSTGSIYRDGNSYIITNALGDGVWVGYNPTHLNVRAFIHENRGSDVEGLLGNNDGDRSNDIALPDGTVLTGRVPATQLYGVYADGWRVTPETTLFMYGAGESTETFTDRNFPVGVISIDDLAPDVRAAAEAAAKAAGLIEGTLAFDNAVLDIALTGDIDFANGAAEAPQTEAEPVELEIQRAPIVSPDFANTLEDTAVTLDVLANDSDPENDTLSVIAASDANGGSVVILSTGALQFTPAANFNGVTELTYTVSDGAGNEVDGLVSVTVAPVNDAPTVLGETYLVVAGTPLVIDNVAGLLANDTDIDGDVLTVTSVDTPANGVLTFEPNGAFIYTANANFTGIETVTYTVSDGNIAKQTNLVLNVLPFTRNGTTGDDVFVGTDITEIFDGKAGDDTVDYSQSNAGVRVSLASSAGDSGYAQGDSYISIENIIGSDLSDDIDILTGDSNGNHLQGLAGDDRIEGGSGSDLLEGGDGNDLIIGVFSEQLQPGLSEVDTLIGGAGNDTFALGDLDWLGYDDLDDSSAGLGDYALIKDFTPGEDILQLHGTGGMYWQQINGNELHIFIDKPGAEPNELIAILENQNGQALGAESFRYMNDADGDGVLDHLDNAINVANPDQRDTDGDGYGNIVDPDFNNDGIVNFADLANLRQNFFSNDANADLDGSGSVNFADLAILKSLFFKPPGPSYMDGFQAPDILPPAEPSAIELVGVVVEPALI
jgi:RHS repeat-associated protein